MARRGDRLFGRPEVVTEGAVSDIELIPDDGEPHRMNAEKEFGVFDRMKGKVGWNVRCAAAVPAGAMARFRFNHRIYLFISSVEACSLAAAPLPRRRKILPCVWQRVPALLSATA